MSKSIIVVGKGPSIEHTIYADTDHVAHICGLLRTTWTHNGHAAIPAGRWLHVMPAVSASSVLQADSDNYGSGKKVKRIARYY